VHAHLADAGIIDINLTSVLSLVIFLITAFLVWRLALGPLTRILEAREAKIQAGIRAAEEAERRLAEVQTEVARILDDARSQAREIIGRARAEAAAEAEEMRTRARRDVEAQVERARAEIAAERDMAVREARAHLGVLVVEATAKVLGQLVDERVHRRLVEDALAEVTAHG
jgi:F-type H+-transporting ATPase subunit b